MTADQMFNANCLRRAEAPYDAAMTKAHGPVRGGNRTPYPVAVRAALAAYDRVLADRREPYTP